MKLRSITEDEYAGLEDADEFEEEEDDSAVYDAEMDSFGENLSKHLNDIKKVPTDFSDGDNLQQHLLLIIGGPPDATWSDEYEGFQYVHPLSPDRRGYIGYGPSQIIRFNKEGIWDYTWDVW